MLNLLVQLNCSILSYAQLKSRRKKRRNSELGTSTGRTPFVLTSNKHETAISDFLFDSYKMLNNPNANIGYLGMVWWWGRPGGGVVVGETWG